MISRLTDRLKSSEPLFAAWCGYRDPFVVSAVSEQDFDVVVLDAQHGNHDEISALECIPYVASAGKSPLVRIPVGRWDMVQRVLDFGALGVIAPMIDDADEARAFVEAAKYPKTGLRSYGPRHAAALYGRTVPEYVLEANDHTLALAQIETKLAFENLNEILDVDGLDGVLMGPSDFSIFMTGEPLPDPYGPDTVDAVAEVAAKTREKGKIAAAFTLSAEHAKLVISQGYQIVSVAMDSSCIASGAKAALDAAKS